MLILFLGCQTVRMWVMFLTSDVRAVSNFRVKVCMGGGVSVYTWDPVLENNGVRGDSACLGQQR
jgi:hypothetical protein